MGEERRWREGGREEEGKNGKEREGRREEGNEGEERGGK